MIYPYVGKLTSSVMKQFFAFSKEHQTLMRSRLRRFLPLSAALHQPKKNSLPVFLVGGIPLSMHHMQCADFDCKTSTRPSGSLRMTYSTPPSFHPNQKPTQNVPAFLHTVYSAKKVFPEGRVTVLPPFTSEITKPSSASGRRVGRGFLDNASKMSQATAEAVGREPAP